IVNYFRQRRASFPCSVARKAQFLKPAVFYLASRKFAGETVGPTAQGLWIGRRSPVSWRTRRPKARELSESPPALPANSWAKREGPVGAQSDPGPAPLTRETKS